MWLAIRAMIQALKKYKGRVVFYTFLSVMLIGLGAAQPYVYKETIDSLVNLFDHSATATPPLLPIPQLIGLWIILAYSQNVLQAMKDWLFWDGLTNPTYIEYLSTYYQKILRLDYNFFIQKKAGALMKIIDNGIEAYSDLNALFFEALLVPSLSFFALLVLAWYQSQPLTIVILILIPIQVGWSYFNYKKVNVITTKKLQGWSKLFGHIGDVINNILTTKSFHQENAEFAKISVLAKNALYHQRQENKIWALFELFDINTISNGAIMIVGYYLIQAGTTSLGTVLMFLSILGRLMVPIQIIKNSIRNIQANGVKFNQLQNLVKKTPIISTIEKPHLQETVKGTIELKKVSFFYNENKEAVKNLSLIIKPGEKVALVGHSGAGKSTLALLLMRFYDVSKGAILLDGVDLKEWDYENLRSHFGVVWQENTLFHTSILNNIRYSNPTASLAAVKEAAKQAYADDFISALPKQYNSIVGERGVKLSGGEKQRIAIARALLKDPQIVILDEATSALDSITEQQVQKGILNLIKHRTAVIIAHRLSTVQHCDKIVVMEKGNILAMGTHKKLLSSCTVYKEMIKLQTQGFLAQ